MSALGQKRTCAMQNVMSALPPKADMCSATRDVRLVPKADMTAMKNARPSSSHSMTSSTMDITPAGIVSSSAFAALRLSTNSNFVGCSTGRLAGFSPLTMRAA